MVGGLGVEAEPHDERDRVGEAAGSVNFSRDRVPVERPSRQALSDAAAPLARQSSSCVPWAEAYP